MSPINNVELNHFEFHYEITQSMSFNWWFWSKHRSSSRYFSAIIQMETIHCYFIFKTNDIKVVACTEWLTEFKSTIIFKCSRVDILEFSGNFPDCKWSFPNGTLLKTRFFVNSLWKHSSCKTLRGRTFRCNPINIMPSTMCEVSNWPILMA